MPRPILVIASAVLALLSPLAQAKDKSEIRTYFFTSDDCNGPTIGGNEDIKVNQCHEIVSGANSMRPSTNKHQDWVNQINSGKQYCWVATYKHHGCQGYPTVSEELPGAINDCISPDEQFLSMVFGCRDEKPENSTTTTVVVVPNTTVTIIPQPITTTIFPQTITTYTVIPQPITTVTVVTEVGIAGYLTTWMHAGSSFTNYVSTILTTSTKTLYPTKSTVTVVPTVGTTTLTHHWGTGTLAAPSFPTITVLPESQAHTVTAYVEDSHYPRERRSDPQPETHALEPRRRGKWKGPRIGVWMKHPWSQAVICYECYAKAPDNTWKFECRSGPNNPISCKGPIPDPKETITVTHTPDVTVTQGAAITSMSVVTVTAGQASPAPTVITTIVGGNPIQSMQTITLGQKEADLDRRSFHRAVRFTHPWYPNTEMCADAEWEERGSKGSEIRIQKPKEDMKKCTPAQQVQYIDANPKTTTIELPPSTVSMIISTSTVYPPSIVTVIGSQPVVTATTISGPPTVTVTTISAPSYITVTHTFPPAPITTTTIIAAPEPPCTTTPAPVSTTTVFVDPEPPCDTVTVFPGFAPTSYTTVYSKRQQLRDL